MKHRANLKMLRLCNEVGFDWSADFRVPYPSLEPVLNSKFVVSEGCVFLGYHRLQAPPNLTDTGKSIYEYDENHFHPDMYIKEDLEDIDHLKAGLYCIKVLSKRLERECFGRRFKVSLSYEPTVYHGDEIDSYASSTVRFYQIREGVQEMTDSSNLEKIDSAVFEVEI